MNDLKESIEEFNDIIENSYINVRLTSYGRGTIDKNSQIYLLNENDLNLKNIEKLEDVIEFKSFKKLVKNIKHNEIKKISDVENDELKYLANESDFEKYQIEINKNLLKRKLIGFVNNSKLTLVNGKFSANAAIMTKYIIEIILKQQYFNNKFKYFVLYRTPTSIKYKLAKLNYLYI